MDQPISITELFLSTLRSPREAARRIMAIDFPRGSSWSALALVAVLSALAGWLGGLLAPTDAAPMMNQLGPWMLAFLVYANMVLLIFALFWTGRLLGGKASMGKLILAVTWIQFMALGLQVVQIFIVLALPPMARAMTFFIMIYLLWILIVFVDEAEGHGGPGRTILHLLVAVIGLIVGMTLILSLIGISV